MGPVIRLRNRLDGHSSTVTQTLIEHLVLTDPAWFDRVLEPARRLYAHRATALVDALQAELPGAFRIVGPEGGLFLWPRLTDDSVDAAALADRAAEHGVLYQQGAFSLRPRYLGRVPASAPGLRRPHAGGTTGSGPPLGGRLLTRGGRGRLGLGERMARDRAGWRAAPLTAAGSNPRPVLEQLRAQLTDELHAHHRALLEIRRLRVDRSDDDEHDPEGSPLSGEWFRIDGMHRTAQQRVRDVDDALARLDAGRYGICERCGGTIAAGRLEALPTATRCVSCAGKR